MEQQGLAELDATVMKDGLVRADHVPLVFRALGTESLPRGTHVRVRVTGNHRPPTQHIIDVAFPIHIPQISTLCAIYKNR